MKLLQMNDGMTGNRNRFYIKLVEVVESFLNK